MRHLIALLLCLFVVASVTNSASAQIARTDAFPNLFNFVWPIDIEDPFDGTDRLFVANKFGNIYVFENDPAVSTFTTYLDLTDRVWEFAANGFLGMAFHPDYENNGYLYVAYSIETPWATRLARYTVSPTDSNVADISSEFILMEIPKVNTYHNGAELAFGSNGYLYVSLGEDGIIANSQDLTTVLGSMIRIDVDTTTVSTNYGIPPDNPYAGNVMGFSEEIWATGLRNPWRFSIDPVTDKIWLADVGLDKWEEINIIEKNGNYGWPILEGYECYEPTPCDTTGLGLTDPIAVYGHGLGNAVVGGHVYRGTRFPDLVGKYIYADNGSGHIWFLDPVQDPPSTFIFHSSSGAQLVSFGVDKDNELFICSFDGRIYEFTGTFTWPSTDVSDEGVPPRARLAQNYPNPFNPQTTLQYTVDKRAFIEIGVFDVGGKRVRTLVQQTVEPGVHSVDWDGTDEDGVRGASGVYFYRLVVEGSPAQTRRMVLLK